MVTLGGRKSMVQQPIWSVDRGCRRRTFWITINNNNRVFPFSVQMIRTTVSWSKMFATRDQISCCGRRGIVSLVIWFIKCYVVKLGSANGVFQTLVTHDENNEHVMTLLKRILKKKSINRIPQHVFKPIYNVAAT